VGAGGGLLSGLAPFRIATENTQFAMPETAIGLFCDVGASFFLSRLDGNLGQYIGMSSRIVKAEDAL
jgi:3-hydroxyisobutyryl-CoA hydrolase